MPYNAGIDSMKNWKLAGVIATAIIVLAFPVYLLRMVLSISDLSKETGPAFVGSNSCIECHKTEYDLWKGSHHDLAMDSALDNTVLGNFNNFEFKHKGLTHRMFRKEGKFFVHTQGTNGKFEDYQIAYTFGYTPLQQYLVPVEGGRLQCLPVAWDTEKKKWFHLADTVYQGQNITPDNWLYWTNQAQNWNGMCADCHSTNLRKNYNPETKTYNTTWSEIDVSCEACHGPASEHLTWAYLPEGSRPENVNTGLLIKTDNLDNTQLLGVCARCHSRRSILGDFKNNNDDLLNGMVPQLITQPLYHADGQILGEDYEYASFTQSKMFEKGVKCSDCHDVHSAETKMDDNQLCLQCHRPDIYNTPKHHFHQMADENQLPKLINRGKPEYIKGSGAQCVNCHMVGKFYMGNDYRRDHSFRNPRPDLTMSIGTPNACNDCHTDKSASWSQAYIEKWYGAKKRPHYGETFAAAQKGDPKAIHDLMVYVDNELVPLMVRATAVHLLGNFNDSLSNKAIEKALSDPNSLIRHSAIMQFQSADAATCEKLLMPLLNDPVKGIRSEAALRLSEVSENMLSEPAKKARNAALEEYKNINLYVSDFPGGRYNLGLMYANKGQFDLAAKAYEEALSIDNLFFMAKVNLAMVYNQQGRNDEAEKLLREVLNENPEIEQVYYSLALLLAEKGEIAESRKYFIRAIELIPEQPRIIYNLALLENSQGNTSATEKYLLQALDKSPDNYDFLYAICTFYFEHEQKGKALPYAKQLVKLYPENHVGKQFIEAAAK
jgi:predicted CXXCH cytochrome family protein